MTDATTTPRRTRPPAPTSISKQARQYLEDGGADGEWPTDLHDTEEWLRSVEAKDAPRRAFLNQTLPADLPVDRKTFQIEGVTTYAVRPTHVPDTSDTPIAIDIHGGGLVQGGGELAGLTAIGPALRRRAITWSPDYRMPPLHPYPAGLDDCIALFRRALEQRPPEKIVVSGCSAGGNLAAALLVRAKDEGLPMPAALVLLTPELDLTESGDSFQTNLGIDHMLSPLMTVNRLYAGDQDLAHPYLSPLFADVTGFPPTFLQTGTRDLFLSNAVRMHRRLLAAGVEVELHVFEAMPHGSFGGTSPEDLELQAEVQRFEQDHLGGPM